MLLIFSLPLLKIDKNFRRIKTPFSARKTLIKQGKKPKFLIMKKSLLIAMALFVGMASFGQKTNQIPKVNPALAKKTVKATKRAVYDQAAQQGTSTQKPNFKAKKKITPVSPMALTETKIGETTYDLQTNGSVANRLVYNANGTVQATWTFSTELNASWADRGAGYNYYDGTSWGAFPTQRIEGPTRTGWPEIVSLANGSEVVISHAPADVALVMSTRNPLGSGTWNVNPLTSLSPGSILWPRAASGGPDGNTIHLIAHNEASTVVDGVTGMVSYSRSLDGGLTWDIQNAKIAGLDSSNYAFLSADGYAISANGNNVAIVYFGALERTVIAKSTNNGSTWTYRFVYKTPFKYDPNSSNTSGAVIGISDLNGDQVADTLANSTDGTGTVIVDNNGVAHVFFGFMDYLDDTPGDGSWSYFPGVNGIGYWNETMGDIEPQFIASALDLDGSGVLLDNYPTIDIALYYSSLTTMPNAGVDANGCIYLTYSGIVETKDQGAQFYRHIYGSKSCDNGCTWSFPIDLTPNDDFAECVFPSMAHNVGAKFHFIYQKDPEPGLNLQGDMDAVGVNEIMHVKEDKTRLDTVIAFCVGGIKASSLVFCTGDSVLVTATCGTSWAWSNGATTQSAYAKTYGDFYCNINTGCGTISDTLNFSAPSAAPAVTVSSSTMTACPGDSVVLSTNNVSSASWLWSTGGTTQSIVVVDTGVFTVTVTNCGGSAIGTITISGPPAPTVTATADTMAACPGDSVTLTTNNVNGATWSWSTGDNTKTIIVTTIGTFIVTVTNCGGSTVDSVTISLPPVPVPAITGGTYLCTGDTLMLSATIGNGFTYVWSTGDTLVNINVDTIGTYSVVITNCSGSDSISVNVTTTPPPAPVISVLGNDSICQGQSVGLIASGAGTGGTYKWSSGETTNTINVTVGGTYTVTGYNACGDSVVSSPVTIVVNPLPPVPAITCYSSGTSWGFVCPQCSTGTFQWKLNGANVGNNDTLLLDWQSVGSGTVTVTLTDANGCFSTSPNGNCFVGIEEAGTGSAISIHPNPNDGQFALTFNNMENDKYSISVKNILGQVVYTKKITLNGNYRMNMDLSEFKSGIYFLTVANSDGEQTQKVIVR